MKEIIDIKNEIIYTICVKEVNSKPGIHKSKRSKQGVSI